ncbi:MAG: transposase domain-containing protein [Mesorhizobium sp.]|nr:MAG: transposase domain-containing protein [Mesorhizobium sp.]
MSERLKVRLAYQRGFQIVDGSTVLAAFENHVEAFKFVHDRGARVWLEWSRTVIGGQSAPYDFTAIVNGHKQSRIDELLPWNYPLA